MPIKRSLSLTTVLLATSVLAQPSPEVHSDHRVTFRLKAPDAKTVQIHCEGVKETTMEKDTNGVWTLTTEPLEPDLYAYSF